MKATIGILSVFVLCGGLAAAESGAKGEVRRAGVVKDARGAAMSGAAVEYWNYEQSELVLKQKASTGADGAFELKVSKGPGLLLARKEGLAPAWKQFVTGSRTRPGDKDELVLLPPASFTGVVVDEKEKPVANANVSVVAAITDSMNTLGSRSVNYLASKPIRNLFSANTDSTGHFRIDGFPTNAAAQFAVRAPGRVLRPASELVNDPESWGIHPGDELKLVVEPAGAIEGKIQTEGGAGFASVAHVLARATAPGLYMQGEREPVKTSADGTFQVPDLAQGEYQVYTTFGTNGVADWVAEPVKVSVESGQTAKDVKVVASRGALLEVAVTSQNEHKPVGDAMVNAYSQTFQASAKSDANGIARIRLVPGDYQVSSFSEFGPAAQTSASVESGKTNRAELEITPARRVKGIVRQPDGKPAAGVAVRLVAGFGPEAEESLTDAEGKFDLELQQRNMGGRENIPCVLVRDIEHNLAAAVDVEEDSGNLDLKLAPALTVAGRAECNGKPVTNAEATLIFWTGDSGMHLSGLSRGTNVPGKFEIPALPPGRKYGLLVAASGYGQKSIYDIAASAEPGRMELDPYELKLANLKLAGKVVDADEKPVAGVNVNLQGEAQSFANARTDREGRFKFEHVCEGTVRVSANNNMSFGNVSAEAGDTNVVITLGERYASSPGVSTHKLKGTLLDPEGKPVVGAELAVFPANGVHWSRSSSNGTFSTTWSLQPWQSQSGGGMLVVRQRARSLAATEDISEDVTNVEVHLKPALAIHGQVNSAEGSPLAGAQVNVWLKAGNSYEHLDQQPVNTDAEGRYKLKCLPPDAQYTVYATAKGRGRSQRQVQPTGETNVMELDAFSLRLANLPLAGQVVDQNDKPVSGVNVNLNGEDQPDGYMTTDSKGRFHFQVCEGTVRLFASGQNGFGQASAEGGDTNIIITLNSSSSSVVREVSRVSLKGSSLPDLSGLSLTDEATPKNKPVLVCLFDAGQRPSRHVMKQLEQQLAALKGKGVALVGIQAAVTSDETFNGWKEAGSVSFPIGRVTVESQKCKWASQVGSFPWLILTDPNHKVVAEGFALDELEGKLKEVVLDSN